MPETKEQVAKHTSAPWDGSHGAVFPKPLFGNDRLSCGAWPIFKHHPGGGSKTVCSVPIRDEQDDEGKANAHLIKAAPDLKDGCNALLGLLQLLAARDDVSDDLRKALTSGHRIDEARAAVAKAEGK